MESDPQVKEQRDHLIGLLATLDDEAFAYLALACTSHAMTHGAGTQIWPDGLGGFRDRSTLEAIRHAAQAYLDSASQAETPPASSTGTADPTLRKTP